MDKKCCSKKGCLNEAIKEQKRGSRPSSWYCEAHYNDLLKAHYESFKNRVEKWKTENPEKYNELKKYKSEKQRLFWAKNKKKINKKRKARLKANPHLRQAQRQRINNWYQANKAIQYANIKKRREEKREIAYKRMTYTLQQINPNIKSKYLCEQEGRMIFLHDCFTIGLMVVNEFPLVDPTKPRLRTGVDLVLPEINLVIEAKASEATWTYNQTISQLQGYQDLVDEMVNLGLFPYSGQFDFINYGIDGSNADLNLKQLYQNILARTRRFLKKGIKFKHLKFKKMEKLFNQRIQQLSKAEFCFKNSAHYDEALVQTL